MRRLPLLPTIVVGLAIAVMIGLGVWQLQRARWKEALISRYQTAPALPPMAWPSIPPADKDSLPLFRRAGGLCLEVVGWRSVAGRNRDGDSGYSHIAQCRTGAEGPGMSVDIGWSADPNAGRSWKGGQVSGLVAPDEQAMMRLVSERGLAGLETSARPGVEAIPNNHRQYAATWFALAVAATAVYAFALRRRWLQEERA